MTISVTKSDILKGKTANALSCPIALAVKRKAKNHDVSVHCSTVRINSIFYELPKVAQDFITYFDTHSKVNPFKFKLEK